MSQSQPLKTWPVEYQKELLIGDPRKSVAVCSLWSDKEYISRQVGLENVALVGNLYSHGPGIEGIIRNLLANPGIQRILVVGKDRTRSAETLLTFAKRGVEKTDLGWTIPLPIGISESELPPGKRTIDSAIPQSAIDGLRARLEILDLRGQELAKAQQLARDYGPTQPLSEPAVYPKSVPPVQIMRGEDLGFVFRGANPVNVWLEILRTIRRFGSNAASQWTSATQELLNVMAVLDGDLEPMLDLPDWVGLSRQSIDEYAAHLIHGEKIDAGDSYTYGERLHFSHGDQVAHLIQQLREQPYNRALYLNLWDEAKDFYHPKPVPPCLTHAWFRVFQNRLAANFGYRSHDIQSAWLKNTLGLRLLQNHVAKAAGLELGPTTMISYSAHIYEHDFSQIDQILETRPLVWQFTEDARGNLIITVADGQIVVRHENSSGSVTIISGTSALLLTKELWAKQLISKVDHALYIGYELGRAEQCLRAGKPYNQDQA